MSALAKQSPPDALYLAGFMGCGKSTAGKLLSQRLAWRFVDLDACIEQEEGMTVAEIFARAGEAGFRKKEHAILRRIMQEAGKAERMVVALGGGTLAQQTNLEMLERAGAITIWIECPIEELLMRCALMSNRPLFRDEASFRRLYEERLPCYQKATFTIHAGGLQPSDVVQQILALPIFQGTLWPAEQEPKNPVIDPR